MAATLDVSAAVSYAVAALNLIDKVRMFSAAEKWGKAAEAARALGAPDCLVVAYAQVSEATALFDTCIKKPSPTASDRTRRPLETFCRMFMDLLMPALEVLDRRRLAGTLLSRDKWAPHEVVFACGITMRPPPSEQFDVDTLREMNAGLLGYLAYLKAARMAFNWLRFGKPRAEADSAPLLTAAQTQRCFNCVETALDMMISARPYEDQSFAFEAIFVRHLRTLFFEDDDSEDKGFLSRSPNDALQVAYGRLQASDRATAFDDLLGRADQARRGAEATAQAEIDTRGLRSCAHCGAREVHVAHFKRCGACKAVVFCCKDCQLANWPSHKAACKAARKAAAASST